MSSRGRSGVWLPSALALLVGAGQFATEKPANPQPLLFEDVTPAAGIDFAHRNSPTPAKYVVETMGSGCAFLDYDGDGLLDIFLVNGGWLPGTEAGGPFDHALYRNQGDGTFRLVTAEAGILENRFYGQGVAVGDYNNDGHDDLFITHFNGPNILYQNNGDGTFTDVTEAAGVAGDGRWSVSAAFLDHDRDGHLDLYVARYINNTFENNLRCGSLVETEMQTYCTPRVYDGIPDLLYRNNGDGTFQDVSRQAGIARPEGKGLGVVTGDFNLNGWTDIYVANDTVRNFLFENQGDGTFSEVGLLRGVAVDHDGNPQAGMGVAMGDFDGDGWPDLAVTNLDFEYLALYRNLGRGFFEDASSQAGVQLPSAPFVGFGLGFLDYDNDSDLDLFAANGHIFDNATLVRPGSRYRQPKLLFRNDGGRFTEVAALHGRALLEPQVSRGMAFGDYDNDGDIDILVCNCGGPPMLLENRGGNRNNWLSIRLVGTESNRNAIGARVTATGDGFRMVRQVTGGGSYASASDYRVHLGLGRADRVARLEIRWPNGREATLHDLEAGRHRVILEGKENDDPSG